MQPVQYSQKQTLTLQIGHHGEKDSSPARMVINDLTPNSSTKPLVNRVEIQEAHATNKKKKKRKPLTAVQQARVAEHLGKPFTLSTPDRSAEMPKQSLILAPYCPKFTPEEQQLLIDLLNQSAYCKNMNLFEVFMVDFTTHWKSIITLANAYDQGVKKLLSLFHEKNDLLIKIYHVYLFIYGKEANETELDIEQNYHQKFFSTIPDFMKWLQEYSSELSKHIVGLEFRHANRKTTKCKRIQSFQGQNYLSLYESLQLLERKIVLFTKSLQGEGIERLFINNKISFWSETFKFGVNKADPLQAITRFLGFINNFADLRIKSHENKINKDLIWYASIIENMIVTKFSKPSVVNFMKAYRIYSIKSLKHQLNFFGHLRRLLDDPSYTYEVLCKEEKFNNQKSCPQPEFRSLLLHTILSLDVIDKWINDLNQTICEHFLAELQEIHVTTPQGHIARLLMMLDLVNTMPSPQAEDSVDPFIQKIDNQIKTLTHKHELKYKQILTSVSLRKVAINLKDKFLAPSSRLSLCQFSIFPILEAVLNYGPSLPSLDKMRQEILHTILLAKQSHQLDRWDSAKLKATIQDLLLKRTFSICIYIMIIEDSKALFNLSRPNDILHLLPNDVVRLLELVGFDQIFLKTSDTMTSRFVVELSNTYNEAEASQQETLSAVQKDKKLKSQFKMPQKTPSKKEVEGEVIATELAFSKDSEVFSDLPTKHDFIEAVKRPLIVKMLEQMGILFKRFGKHPIFQHQQTSGQVVVPHYINDLGTRDSIYKQAFAALTPKK